MSFPTPPSITVDEFDVPVNQINLSLPPPPEIVNGVDVFAAAISIKESGLIPISVGCKVYEAPLTDIINLPVVGDVIIKSVSVPVAGRTEPVT